MKHADVWAAIDQLAKDYGLSPSGLARKAGLDPTTFNKSKRVSPDGKPRWPSTESISKVLDATGATIRDFTRLVESGARLDELDLLQGEGVVVEMVGGGVRTGLYQSRNRRTLYLQALDAADDEADQLQLPVADVVWVARLVWMRG